MKRILITLTFMILILIFWFLYLYRSTCEGCGGCGYEKFKDRVQVKKIIWKNDLISEIYFTSTIDTNTLYQLYPDEIDYAETNFPIEAIKDTSERFTMYGDQIAHGACVPYMIDSMFIDKK